MSKDFFGALSGALVILSAIPYMLCVYRRDTSPNLTTWFLWSFIGLALLLTYRSSGAEANIWPAVFGFTNPVILTVLILWRGGDREALTWIDWACGTLCLSSLVGWFAFKDNPDFAAYALCLAILADAFAAIPTVQKVYRNPSSDRPGMWFLFAFAWAIALLAIPDWSRWSNWILALWLFSGPFVIAIPLARHCIKNHIPLKKWI